MSSSFDTAVKSTRRNDLDWLRVIAFGVLIFYHIGMFYVTWDWHIKSRFTLSWLELPMSMVNPWRLPLLFVVSGAALRLALTRSTPGRIAWARLARIGLPLLFGFYVLVCPQAYYELLAKGEVGPGFWAFYADYLDFDFEFSILTPTWNHLWYLAYLLIYSLLICLLYPLLARLGQLLRNMPAGLLLLAPLPLLAACELLLAGRFPVTHALIDDWYTHATSVTFMLFGFALATQVDAWRSIERYRTILVTAALALGLAYAGLRFGRVGRLSPEAMDHLRTGYGFAVVMAALALAQRYLNRPSPVLAPINAAMLPCYVLHQTLIVCLGAWATAWGLNLGAEVSLIVVGTLVGCALGYAIISQIPLLRPLFGMSMRARLPAGSGTGQPVRQNS